MNFSKHRGKIILIIDLCLIYGINFLLFLPELIRGDIAFSNLFAHIGMLLVCFFVMQMAFRTYETLWRYAESREYMRLLLGMGLGFVFYMSVNLILGANRIWITKALTGTALAMLAMLLMRFSYRIYRRNLNGENSRKKSNIAIIGAGTAGASLAAELLSAPDAQYKPYLFIDDDPQKQRKRIQGVRVYGPVDDLEEILRDSPVSDVVLAIAHLTAKRRAEILNLCAKTKCRLQILDDPITQLHQGKASSTANLRKVEIEDLLGREPIQLDNQKISDYISGKTVLVTGGGGSIGSELCRQIGKYQPKRLVILDIAENTTYELQNDLIRLYGRDFPMSVEIASVRDLGKVEQVFERYHPELVFHAAAHKHVPLMENCPEEAIKNNVLGTYHVAITARKNKAEKFVLISTDKAVNPTNIMGTTKYLCEQMIQGLRDGSETEFTAVRFGNVLGSNGSVIPLFRKQIEQGGPVTITDKRIIRYFMTIPEAVQLVLEAGSYAHGGEIYVLDMGQPVHILDLAEKMIQLSGHQPYTEIPIVEVGLRPGEKLYEELLTASAELSKTGNEKIFVEKKNAVDAKALADALLRLKKVAEEGNREAVFRVLHEMVPTFRDPEIVNAEAIRASRIS